MKAEKRHLKKEEKSLILNSPAVPPKSFGGEAQADGQKGRGGIIDGKPLIGIHTALWFTNLDHGRRHQPLPLMTIAENLKYSKHKEIKGKKSYDKYDNYNAIEIPFTDAIPSDYKGMMGVPIIFMRLTAVKEKWPSSNPSSRGIQ